MLSGAVGIGGVELVPVVAEILPAEPSGIVQVVIQVVIGIITIIRLLKKKKDK